MKEPNGKQDILLEAANLCKSFPMRDRWHGKRKIQAVCDVSFQLRRGETLGIVGESGCGKTTLARSLLRIVEPTSGSVVFKGENLLDKKQSELRELRKKIQLVFQDPYSSLNPRMTIQQTIEEPLIIHGMYSDQWQREKRVSELLHLVGLNESCLDRYPHEFSGGQRQRVVIARALATEPELVICDEPVSALDVSVRAQILNLLRDLQDKLGLTYLFISHDLSVVEYICDRVIIMYLGQIVESGPADDIFMRPLHPYTRALLSASPKVDSYGKRNRIILEGDVPSLIDPPSGCRFRTRCPYANEFCVREPSWETACEGHEIRCHRWQDIQVRARSVDENDES